MGVYVLRNQGLQLFAPSPARAPAAGSPIALSFMPNGDLIAAGAFNAVPPLNAAGIARFDGTSWHDIDGGLSGGLVVDLAQSDAGELFACGSFESAGGNASMGLARARTPCPASVVTFGAGCIGSAGAMQLAPGSQPWLGSTVSATASGFSQQSLGVHVIGVPVLPTSLPLSPPGCTLQVSPLQTDLVVPGGGSAQASFLIPNDPNLVGIVLRTQVVAVELDANGNLQQLTSTNALQMTIGTF